MSDLRVYFVQQCGHMAFGRYNPEGGMEHNAIFWVFYVIELAKILAAASLCHSVQVSTPAKQVSSCAVFPWAEQDGERFLP